MKRIIGLFIFLFLASHFAQAQRRRPRPQRFRDAVQERRTELSNRLDTVSPDSLEATIQGLPPHLRKTARQVLREVAVQDSLPLKGILKNVFEQRVQQAAEKRLQELQDSVLSLYADDENMQKDMANMVSEVSQYNEEFAKQELLLTRTQRMIDMLQMKNDSIERQRIQDSLILSQKDAELSKSKIALKDTELRWYRSIGIAAFALLAGITGFWLYARSRKFNHLLQQKNEAIKEEQDKSEKLLLNILPKPIADELKEKGNALPKAYKQVSILFTDFKNFSQISNQLPADQLVEDLDYCFKKFDEIIDKYQLEKIKTIGDAYMCAGGLPKPDDNHPIRIIYAALDIQKFLSEWKIERIEAGKIPFEARVGIHTGPLVAGVVGAKKFAYDVWGSTVNIAARMEAKGETGKVNISASTYDLVKDQFVCEHRGKIPAKNIGEIDMYFVNV